MTSATKRFRVAISYSSERRAFVAKVAERLAEQLGREKILFDVWHEAEFARPRLTTFLPNLYLDQAELVVVFLSPDYQKKEWCGLEWDAIQALVMRGREATVMLLCFDNTEMGGLLANHGYARIGARSPVEIANLILERLGLTQLPPPQRMGVPGKAIIAVMALVALAAIGNSARHWMLQSPQPIQNPKPSVPAVPEQTKTSGNTAPSTTDGKNNGQPVPVEDPTPLRATPEILSFSAHTGAFGMAFTRDSQMLVSWGDNPITRIGLDETLKFWDVKDGHEAKGFAPAKCHVNSVRLSPDGTAIAVALNDGSARVWTVTDRTEHVIHREPNQQMTAVSFSPDNSLLAVGTNRGVIRIFEWKTKRQLAECIGHGEAVIGDALRFSKDGRTLISAGKDDSLRAWEVKTGQGFATILNWQVSGISSVQLSDSPDRVLVIDRYFGTSRIKLTDLKAEKVVSVGDERFISDFAVSDDGTKLTTIGHAGLQTVETSSLKVLGVDNNIRGWRLRFLPGAGSRLFVISQLRLLVYKVDGVTFDLIREEQRHTKPILELAVSPDGKIVATGDESGVIKLWDTKTLSQPKP